MTAQEFAYWLMGYFELSGPGPIALDAKQTEAIRRHPALVFAHDIDPKAGGPEVQAKLSHIHSGPDSGDVKLRC